MKPTIDFSVVTDSFLNARPSIGLVLGSGWGEIADMFEQHAVLPYADIPGLGATGVAGHAGRLIWGKYVGMETLIFQGRRHWYEQVGWDPILAPVRICKLLGVRRLILTNAAGGIRADLTPGALMLVEDHINAMGTNPLLARSEAERVPFFNDQTAVYNNNLRKLAATAAAQCQIPMKNGVYVAVCGPSYETPAEIQMYRACGADAIGMSTVPEAMLAHALGLQVFALSCITNTAAGIQQNLKLNHQDVTQAADKIMPILRRWLAAFWQLLADDTHGK